MVEWTVVVACALLALGLGVYGARRAWRVLRSSHGPTVADAHELLAHVCELPRAVYQSGRSILSLLQETGLDQHRSLLTESAVAQYLSEHPDAVQAWFRWSEDKRVDAGWYVYRQASGYIVGFHPGGEELLFTDAVEACTPYVMCDVGRMLQHLRTAKPRGHF